MKFVNKIGFILNFNIPFKETINVIKINNEFIEYIENIIMGIKIE